MVSDARRRLDFIGAREYSMSLVRPLLVSLLCSMILLGHAPAWFHLAGCSHGPEGIASSNATDGLTCSHGCAHHDESGSSNQEESQSSNDPSQLPADHEHDSDTCAVCQSLVAPTGIQWQNDVVTVRDAGDFLASSVDSSRAIAAQLLLPQPRGPPAIS